ncbi:MAG: hypothetical protein HN416_12650 [Nitrospina sp.]|jgi:hypothetical protein|nr:hypothetical protein [Nitrospina sp.]
MQENKLLDNSFNSHRFLTLALIYEPVYSKSQVEIGMTTHQSGKTMA